MRNFWSVAILTAVLILGVPSASAAPYDCADMWANLKVEVSFVTGLIWFEAHNNTLLDEDSDGNPLRPGTNGDAIDYIWRVADCSWNTDPDKQLDVGGQWPNSYWQGMPACVPATTPPYPQVNSGKLPSGKSKNWNHTGAPGAGGHTSSDDKWAANDVITISIAGCGGMCPQNVKIQIASGCQ